MTRNDMKNMTTDYWKHYYCLKTSDQDVQVKVVY